MCYLHIILLYKDGHIMSAIVNKAVWVYLCVCFSGFQAYLSTAPNYDFITYRQMVHEVTQTFSSLSQRIIEIQNELSKCKSLTNLAACIGNVQTLEQNKLEQVNSLSWSVYSTQTSDLRGKTKCVPRPPLGCKKNSHTHRCGFSSCTHSHRFLLIPHSSLVISSLSHSHHISPLYFTTADLHHCTWSQFSQANYWLNLNLVWCVRQLCLWSLEKSSVGDRPISFSCSFLQLLFRPVGNLSAFCFLNRGW